MSEDMFLMACLVIVCLMTAITVYVTGDKFNRRRRR